MNCTPGSVDGTLPMCRERLVAVTGRSSPASCWPGTVTVEEPVTDSGCDDNTPCHNNSLVTQLQQLVRRTYRCCASAVWNSLPKNAIIVTLLLCFSLGLKFVFVDITS